MMIPKKVSEWVRKLTGQTVPEATSKTKEKVLLGMKRCPQCTKLILRSAVKCIHCGHFFEPKIQ